MIWSQKIFMIGSNMLQLDMTTFQEQKKKVWDGIGTSPVCIDIKVFKF